MIDEMSGMVDGEAGMGKSRKSLGMVMRCPDWHGEDSLALARRMVSLGNVAEEDMQMLHWTVLLKRGDLGIQGGEWKGQQSHWVSQD